MLNFKNENLDRTDFTELDAPESRFDTCSMIGCSFEGNFEESEFLNCQMSTSEFAYSSLEHSKFLGVKAMLGLSFETSNLTGVELNSFQGTMTCSNSDLSKASFKSFEGSLRLSGGSDFIEGKVGSSSDFALVLEGQSKLKDTFFFDNGQTNLLVKEGELQNIFVEGGRLRVSLQKNSVSREMTVRNCERINFTGEAASTLETLRVEDCDSSYFNLLGSTDYIFLANCQDTIISFRGKSKTEGLTIKDSSCFLDAKDTSIHESDIHQSHINGKIRTILLKDIVITKTTLDNLQLHTSKVVDSRFESVRAGSNTYFYESIFRDTRFTLFTATTSDFSTSTFKDCFFATSTLSEVTFERSYFKGVSFRDTTFKSCSMESIVFQDCIFIDCVFDKCDLKGASFVSCKFDDRAKTFSSSDTSTATFL